MAARKLLIFVVATSLALSGCGTINPYQRAAALDRDLDPAKPIALAGGVDHALADLNAQRVAWFDSLSAHARTANMASLLVYSLTAWGLYQGLKPGFVANGTANASSRRLVALAGIGAGGAYTVGNLFINPLHDETYVEGFRALTCLMARSRPYLLATDDAEALQTSVAGLQSQLLALDMQAVQWRTARAIDADARSANADQRTLAAAERVLGQSRKTLERGQALQSRIGSTGFQLRRQADLVVASVSEEIRRNNKGITSPEVFLSSLQAVTGRFQAIEPVKEEATDDAAPAVGASGAAASSTAGGMARQLAVLQERVADLTTAVQDPAVRKARAERQQDKAQKQVATDLATAKRQIEDLKGQIDKANAETRRALADGGGERLAMAAAVARLYAKRREVNQYLVNHKDLGDRVKNIPECRAGGPSTMVIVPSEDKTVAPGGSFRFHVSGAKGVPVVSLDGNPGTPEPGAKSLAVSIEGGVVVIDVQIAPDAPPGALRLLVHDPASRAVEDVVLTVEKPAATGEKK